MKKYLFLILTLTVACQSTQKTMQATNESFDIQGHRGCRGLMPENTIPAFLKAIDIGVTTLELDVVVSKDGQLVVSHEPYLSPIICTNMRKAKTSKTKKSITSTK